MVLVDHVGLFSIYKALQRERVTKIRYEIGKKQAAELP